MSSPLKPEFFDLKTGGLSKEEKAKAFEALNDVLKTQSAHFLGYQANQGVNHGLHLNHYMTMHVNNIGDPFTNGGFTINSKAMEVAVLDYFARLWHAKTPYSPTDPESYWGYVLSMGSTEGNMYGMWQARDYLKGKTLFHEPETVFADAAKNTRIYGATTVPFLYRNVKGKFRVLNSNPEREKNAKKPIAYFSEDTHYSITKICRVLDVPTFYDVGTELYPNDCPLGGEWPQTVPSNANGNGDVDIDKLLILVEFFANKGHPPIINLNYGSTFKGAYDDVETIGNRLVPMLKKYGLDEREVVYAPGKSDIRTGYWLHVDGALGSTYAPYLHMAHQKGSYSGVVPPKFDFALPFVHSIGASGHKWPGVPWPCGIFMTKVKYQIKPPSEPNYIASPDTTFAGSRNGYSPIVLWNFYADMGFDHLQKSIISNLHLAEYAQQKLAELSAELGQKHGKTEEEKRDWLWVARAPASLTIRFRRPVPELVYKYSLSGESLYVDAPGKTVKPIGRPKKEKKGAPQPKERVQRDYAHIYIMYHSTKERVDALLADLRKPGAFDANKTEKTIKIEVTAEPAATGDRALLSIKPLKGQVLAAQVEGKDIKSRAAKSASNYRGF